MRNVSWAAMCIFLLAGCAPQGPSQKEQLNSAYRALDQKQYDRAISEADDYLHKYPTGPGTAEALYLEGRVYEERAEAAGSAREESAIRANLDAARTAYSRGSSQPNVPLDVQGLLHAGMANASYHADDYGTAVREWQLAFDHVQPADAKAWVLYRIGVCQQRLGWFAQADRTFASVRKQFAGTEPAARAATHEGANAFFVQVGTYSDNANADKTVNTLRSQGLVASKQPAPGHAVVKIGPIPTYADARAVRLRVAGQYPGATIQP